MKKAFVFLAAGFEEMEAIGTIDILRRGGIETVSVSISDSKEVVGAHGIPVIADAVLAGTDLSDADALVLPGGMPGSTNLNNCAPLRDALARQYNDGKLVAAICAAPLVLGSLGILEERRATCYPGFEDALTGATVTNKAVEVDGNIITGRGPGLVMEFALALVTYLTDKHTADEVASGLLLK